MSGTRAAVVTGGSRGIGLAAAEALGAAGFDVLIVGMRARPVEEAVARLRARHPRGDQAVTGMALDVRVEADMERMARAACEQFGRIDVLVASAGVGRSPGSERLLPYATTDLPLEEWRAVIDINLTGIFLSNRAVLPAMIAQGGGTILNVCSSTTPHGLRGQPYAPAYCASKFGVVGFSESLAEEVGRDGIRVQVIHPGAVDTELVADTRLMARFGKAMSAASMGQIIAAMATMPAGTTSVHPHALPFSAGRRPAGASRAQH